MKSIVKIILWKRLQEVIWVPFVIFMGEEVILMVIVL